MQPPNLLTIKILIQKHLYISFLLILLFTAFIGSTFIFLSTTQKEKTSTQKLTPTPVDTISVSSTLHTADTIQNCDATITTADTKTAEDFLKVINEYRKKEGKNEVALSPTLTRAAKWMSQDMAKSFSISHTDSLGRHVKERLRDCGYLG